MEFNGFLGSDFEFFKKKDKLEKEAYERGRNEVKVHFRGLCYEIQKIYHQKTGGVLELQRDFQNFNRRSSNIAVEHGSGDYKISIALNSDALEIELVFEVTNREECTKLIGFLRDRKNLIWERLMSSKQMHIYLDQKFKSRKNRVFSFNSLELNGKSYEAIIKYIEAAMEEQKYAFTLGMGLNFNKKECVRQGRMLLNSVYDTTMEMMQLKEKLG